MGNFKGTMGKWFLNKRNRTLIEIRNSDNKLVCELENYERNVQIMSFNELEANAKLIASAPDLLEALMASKAVFEALGIYANHRIAGEQYDKVVQSIKKATE